ncbi:dihydroorotate dehydrogenase electron transfer subunit [Lentibacillus sediminis]|uniref:dihydroorotate dehydrogenase electron transfer subunit n=1 Tax=Lentibacillus sediminis TaxID=1940529 RepID=UPI000C1C61DF|nr:dihydroorotate dehydrogenase electron transfer subunit [Lentibacillus sediminis]
MIKKEMVRVESSSLVARDTVKMVLENEYISRLAVPGQFLHVEAAGHTLRRPISIADADREIGTVTIIFRVTGSGTKQLASCQPGMTLTVLGPNGNGFPFMQAGSRVLLIGGGIGVPPLYYLGRSLAVKPCTVKAILGFQSAADVFYEKEFREFAGTVIVTNDGSFGEKGLVTDVIEQAGSFDYYYTCGPTPMLQAVTRKLKRKPGFVSMEEYMGCGVGACFACAIPARDGGYKKICKDGPVFPAEEVRL